MIYWRFGSRITRLVANTACSVHPIPDKERRGHGGGTAARRDGVRVFKQFSWLGVGSVKVALSRPTTSGYPLQGATQTQAVGRLKA
jgi:hypothetical protein